MPFRPRLRTVLITLNLLVLILPLGGVAALRIYDNELVRQTEAELISQASLAGAMFREVYLKEAGLRKEGRAGSPAHVPPAAPAEGAESDLAPIPPRLDLAASKIHNPAAPAAEPAVPPDPTALAAGRELNAILADARRTVLSGMRIVDRNGIVVATSNAEMGLSLAAREEVARALDGEQASLLRVRNSKWQPPALESLSRGAGVRVFVAQPVVAGEMVIGAVIASRTPLDTAKALFRIRGDLMKVALVLLLVVVLMATMTAYYINRPVKALMSQAERLKRGDSAGGDELRNPGIQEVAQLSSAIADMAVTLEQRSLYITTFATNVSHEFKTPLTSIHGAVELLKEHFQEMSREERDNFLSIIDAETGRMERLVRRLLDLARADTLTVGDERCDAGTILMEIAEKFRGRGLAIETELGSGSLHLAVGAEALETIVGSILENCRVHGGPEVTVHLSGEKAQQAEKSQYELVIHDNGPGIPPQNRDKVFKEFFTTAREKGGTGLGLSIVQALIRAHGGAIALEESSAGARFRIVIPLALGRGACLTQ